MARSGHSYEAGCPCPNCKRGPEYAHRQAKKRQGRPRQREGGWSDRMSGTIDNHEVTVKFGHGTNEGHALIDDADRESSNRAFDRRGEHNHYGPRREGDGFIDEDRGYYTGPGH